MLILPIKKKWFDMILSGENKEEYREIKPYYDSRLLGFYTDKMEHEIFLRNGYGNDKPTIKCKIKVVTGTGKAEWGAEPYKMYYVLKILSVEKID